MYGKIFTSIYEGTLGDHWKALITFQQMIILCNEDGTIDMTPSSLSRITGIPIEIIQEGIECLEKEDPGSRTPDENGKRIIRIDDHRNWGWRIVNHEYYKRLGSWEDKKKADRERIAAKRESERVANCRDVSQTVADVAHTNTNIDTNIDNNPPTPQGGNGVKNQYSESFEKWWSIYPRKVGKLKAFRTWQRIGKKGSVTVKLLMERLKEQVDKSHFKGSDGCYYIPNPEKWLNGGHWDDEIKEDPKKDWI